MSTGEVIEFLRGVSPFQDLDEATLHDIAGGVSMEFYTKGSIVLYQDGPASEYLRVIRKGSVRVFRRSGDNEEISLGTRSEYDTFGSCHCQRWQVKGQCSGNRGYTCYLISKGAVVKLLESNAAFVEYFFASYLNIYIDKTYNEIHKSSLLYGGGTGDYLLLRWEISSPGRRLPYRRTSP